MRAPRTDPPPARPGRRPTRRRAGRPTGPARPRAASSPRPAPGRKDRPPASPSSPWKQARSSRGRSSAPDRGTLPTGIRGAADPRLTAHEQADPAQSSQKPPGGRAAEVPRPSVMASAKAASVAPAKACRGYRSPGRWPRLAAVDRQVPVRQAKGDDAKRHVDQEDRAPAETGDQEAAKRRAKRGADRGHRSEQAHGAAGLRPSGRSHRQRPW